VRCPSPAGWAPSRPPSHYWKKGTRDRHGRLLRRRVSIFTRIMSGYGIESTFLDLRDLVDVEDAFRPERRWSGRNPRRTH